MNIYDMTDTWGDVATTFTAIKMNVTDTASASGSLLMDLQVGGNSKFKVDKVGKTTISVYGDGLFIIGDAYSAIGASSGHIRFRGNNVVASAATETGLSVISTACFKWSSNSNPSSTPDLTLFRDAANILAQRNSTNAQTFRLYNTYTSSTSFESLQFQWDTNEARIGTSVGSAGGTQRVMNFGVWNSSGTWKSMLSFNDTTQLLTIPSPYTLSLVLLQLSGLSAQIRGHLGNITLTNHTTANDFGLLRFGGIFNTYPAIKRNGTALNFRLADDSADCGITASTGVFSGQLTNALGTITASTPATFTQTWNDGATTFTGALLNITDTASASASLLMDLQVGGSSKFRVDKSGNLISNSIITKSLNNTDSDIIRLSDNKYFQWDNSTDAWNPALRFSWGGASSAIWGNSGSVDISVQGAQRVSIKNNAINFHFSSIGFNSWASPTAYIRSGASNLIEIQNSTNAQTFRVYNTYTDASNYIRQSQSFTSYGGTIYAQLAAEGAGTGDVNVPFVVSPKGTGAFILGPMPDGTATGGDARGQYAVDLQMYRSAATQVVGGDYGVGIGTQITISGNSGTVGIGRNISIQDSLGGSVCLGRNITASVYRSVAIGNGVTVGGDAIGIGTGTYATHGNAICFMGSRSRFNGHILWEGSFYPVPAGTSYNNHTHIGGLEIGTAAVRTVDTTPTILSNTISSSSITTRQRHKGAVLQNDFTITAIRSDGAINKYCRRVWVKDLSNVAGTASTLSILSIDVVGTDVTEISGASITVGVNNTTRSIEISVTGEAGFSATGVATTDIITAVGHTFTNDDVVVFTSLTGGDGLTSNAAGLYYAGIYKVINVNGDDFQLANVGSSTTPIDFTTDITSGTITRPINWYKTAGRFAVSAGGY